MLSGVRSLRLLAVFVVTALLWLGEGLSDVWARWGRSKVRRSLAFGIDLWLFGGSVALFVVALSVNAYWYCILGLVGAAYFARELRRDRQQRSGNI